MRVSLPKRLSDFLYWYRRGGTIREAWRLSGITL